MNDYATPGEMIPATYCQNCWGLLLQERGQWGHVDEFCHMLMWMRPECRPEDVAFWSGHVEPMLDGAEARPNRPGASTRSRNG